MSDGSDQPSPDRPGTPSSNGTQYGLPDIRDPNTGQRRVVEHEFEWNGRTVTIELNPPTGQQVERWEQFGEEVSFSKMEEAVDEILVSPDIPVGDYTVRELNCYFNGIADYAMQGSEMETAVVEELEERGGEPSGN